MADADSPRFASFVNDIRLDLIHLAIYVPHCNDSDDDRYTQHNVADNTALLVRVT